MDENIYENALAVKLTRNSQYGHKETEVHAMKERAETEQARDHPASNLYVFAEQSVSQTGATSTPQCNQPIQMQREQTSNLLLHVTQLIFKF